MAHAHRGEVRDKGKVRGKRGTTKERRECSSQMGRQVRKEKEKEIVGAKQIEVQYASMIIIHVFSLWLNL